MARDLYRRILNRSLRSAYGSAVGFCTSRQLRKHMYYQSGSISRKSASGRVISRPYWSLYYHEGRQVIRPVSASVLVWFRNPKDDPRLNNGESPVYRSQIRKMTRDQFQYWSRRNKQYPKGQQPMIVAKRSPRSGQPSFRGNPFFSDKPGGGLATLKTDVGRISEQETFKYVEERLRSSGLKNKKVVVNL